MIEYIYVIFRSVIESVSLHKVQSVEYLLLKLWVDIVVI